VKATNAPSSSSARLNPQPWTDTERWHKQKSEGGHETLLYTYTSAFSWALLQCCPYSTHNALSVTWASRFGSSYTHAQDATASSPTVIIIVRQCAIHRHHLRVTAATPNAAARRVSALDNAVFLDEAEALPGLVAPRTFFIPVWPFEVARSFGSM